MMRLALLAVVAVGGGWLSPAPARAFETNGKLWNEMPIPYYINPEACPVLSNGDHIEDIVAKATQAWSGVVCADVSFQFLGTTSAMWAADGQNTIYCVDGKNQEWAFGEGAAGATLWIPTEPGQPMEVDLALNTFDLNWIPGGGDPLTGKDIDPASMITHELGHWLGLSHSPDPFATMYYASLPFAIQLTVDGDDKAGLCTLYPSGETECETDQDCPDKFECVDIAGIPVCRETHAGPGEPCNKEMIDCAGMCWVSFYECSQLCLFTNLDYSEGYCAPLCETSDCPEGFKCTHVQQPGVDVHVCFLDDSLPEAGPELIEAAEQEDLVEVVEVVEAVDPVFDLVEQPELSAPESAVEVAADPGGPGDIQPPGDIADVDAADPVKKDGGGCQASGAMPAGGLLVLMLALALACLRRVSYVFHSSYSSYTSQAVPPLLRINRRLLHGHWRRHVR